MNNSKENLYNFLRELQKKKVFPKLETASACGMPELLQKSYAAERYA